MKKMTIALLSIFVLANIAFAEEALLSVGFIEKIPNLTEGLSQKKQEVEENAKQNASSQPAKDILYNKYPEFVGTALEPVLIEKFKANPNFTIKDIHYDSNENIFINKQKVLDRDEEVIKRIYLLNNDPTLMADYRRLLRAHRGMPARIRAAIKEKIGKDYTYSGSYGYNKYDNANYDDFKVYKPLENIPLKCRHTISYVTLKDFMEYIPNPRCDKSTMLHMYNYLPSKLVMVDGEFASHYIDNVDKRLELKQPFFDYTYSFEGCVFFATVIDRDIWNPEGKPWKNKIHNVHSFVFPADYKCEETLAQVELFGIH